jgi:hypothetical protein
MNERTLSQPSHWAEVISQITDKLTGKNMSVTYEFDDLTIDIPSARGPGGRDIGGAEWKINGKITVTTETYQKGSVCQP